MANNPNVIAGSSAYFDGASTGYRLRQKGLCRKDDIVSLEKELPFLRQRSRWLIANDGFAFAGCERAVGNWVGAGIHSKWDNKVLQSYWEEFCKQPTADGKGDMLALQRLMGMEIFSAGEFIARKRSIPKYGRTIPFYLQVLPSDYLPTGQIADKPKAVAGITFDQSTTRPISYHFYNRHPRSSIFRSLELKTVTVQAGDVIHAFDRTRAGQWRGFPKLTSVMVNLFEIQDLTDATIVRQKAAQAIAWIVKKHSSGKFNPLGTPTVNREPAEDDGGLGPLASGNKANPEVIEDITPGGVHYLEADEDLIVADPSDIGGNLIVLLKLELRKIAVGLGITYEQLTGDLTDVNYSSIRAGMLELYNRIAQFQQVVIISDGLQPIADMFQEYASAWTGEDFSEATIRFELPKKGEVDPGKAVKADVMELEGDRPMSTWQQKVEERGVNFEDHLKQLMKEARSVEKLRKLNNPTDRTNGTTATESSSNNGRNTSSGSAGKEVPKQG